MPVGIVIKQSFKNSLSTYIGFGIGAINTLYLYINCLTDEYYGLTAFVLSTANIMLPFMAFGVQNALIKFYSGFKTRSSQNSFLTLMLYLPFIIIIPAIILGVFAYDTIASLLSKENALIYNYLWHIFIIAVAMAYFEIFFAWSKIHMKTVFGTVLKEIFHRVCIMVLLCCVYMKWISVSTFINCVVAVYVIRMLIMKFYAYTLRLPKITFKRLPNISAILKYCVLIIVAGSVAMLLLDIDKFMISQYLKIENVAYYSVAIFIATVISVPQRAMHQIMMPITAKFLNENNITELGKLYKKSSLNLLIISGLLFLLIVLNIEMLYQILPNKFSGGLFVVFIICLAKLFDNMMGNNNAILFNSDYYRVILLFGVFLAILAVVLNSVLIPTYGLNGSAFATFLAFVIYNSLKLIFVKQKLNMQPFCINTLKVCLLIGVLGLALYFVNFWFHPVLNIILKSVIIVSVYSLCIYKFKLSEDITTLINTYIKS